MTDLVARLREAIDETERIAREADGGTWVVGPTFGGRDNRVYVKPEGYGIDTIGTCIIAGQVSNMPQYRANAQHIARHDPAAVLRRCAADRKILDAWDANERELEANSAEFSRPARPMEDEAERFRRLGNAKAQGWELQGRRWALRLALTGLAEAYGVEA